MMNPKRQDGIGTSRTVIFVLPETMSWRWNGHPAKKYVVLRRCAHREKRSHCCAILDSLEPSEGCTSHR
jgi:hypothetical protein